MVASGRSRLRNRERINVITFDLVRLSACSQKCSAVQSLLRRMGILHIYSVQAEIR